MSLFRMAQAEAIARVKKERHVQAQISELQKELASLYTVPGERPELNQPEKAVNVVLYEMSALTQEEMWIASLNTRNGLIGISKIYRGSLNTSQVRVGELFRIAILDNAASVIVFHNHPSGDPMPSPDDVAVTRAIVQAGKLLDINVLDHIVIAGGRYDSLRQRGLGF